MLKTLTHALPSGYTELQYITSSGTQYINTGVIPDNTTGFKVKMAVPETVSDIFRFGCRQNSSDTRFIIGTMTGSAYLGFGNTLAPIAAGSWAITQNTQFVAQLNYLNDRHAYINDIISSTDPIRDMSETTFTYPLIMFGRNSAGSITSSAQTIYSCEITKGSELVRNFIPAQNASNVVGMYDTVTDTFFTNSGTGDFTAGPAVATPTKELKEIHELYKRNSDGTSAEYIGELYAKSKNLFKISGLAGSATVSYSGDTITIGSTNADSGKTLLDIFPDAQVGHTYYLSRDNSSTAKAYIWLRSGGAGGQWAFGNAKTLTDADFNGTVKFYGDTANTTIVKMQIEEGSTATEYHPYGVEEIFSAGYDTTITGASPLTLPNARAKATSWEIDGNSGQSGTPTPTSPVEVYGVGDKTEQLFNKDTMGTSCNGSLSSIGSISVNGTSGTFKIPCEPNTQYTIGFIDELETTIFRVATTENEFVGTAMATLDHSIGTSRKTYTFTTNANAHWLYMQTNSAKLNDVKNVLMLVKDTTAPTEYIPYGYKVPILKAENCGMVDMGTLNWNPIGNGCFYTAIIGKANGRNIYCSKYPTDQSSMASATANMHIGGHDGNRVYFKNTSLENTRAAAQADLSGVYLYYQRTTDTTWTAPTTSTIYLPAPLQKVGTYTDSVESDGTLTRGVGVMVLDGTEEWQIGQSFTDGTYRTFLSMSFPSVDSATLCSHFEQGQFSDRNQANQGNKLYINTTSIQIRSTQFDSPVSAKSWLAAQYAAGTPVIIYYPLATPTEETVAVPTISTATGTNYLAVESEVAPSNMSATYRKKTLA